MTTVEISKVSNKVKALVSSALFDLFNDPDFGLELSMKAKKRLAVFSKPRKTFSLSQIKKKYI